MKKLLLLLLIFPLFLQAQTNKWIIKTTAERSFVKNEGQYDGRNWQSTNKIEFALSQQDGWFTFFTKKGITHRLERLTRNPNKIKGDHNSPSRVHISELIDVFFLGANSNVHIVAEDKTSHYYSYAVKDIKTKNVTNINNVYGYEKITYKNIYNNIDIEYTIHPDGGIKYNVILHPGADPSQIKMRYKTSHTNIQGEFSSIKLNTNGQIEINTSLGDIVEHKPVTFYESSKAKISSVYKFVNNVLTFELGNYDNSKKVIIDPWVVTPVWDDGDFTREVETDGAGNVYVIGGETPMQLRKYSIAGALIWTYNTPWDTTGGDWLGTLATDDLGTSYITQGTASEIERIDNAGNMIWHNNGSPGGFTASYEYWSITFNCDNTKLIVGGTESSEIFPFPISFWASIFDIDVNTGNVLATAYVDTTVFGTAGLVTPVEVRSISSSKNAQYIFLTHEDVGAISQDFSTCPNPTPTFQNSNTETLSYKCENYLSADQNGGGLKALIANDNFFYTHKGDEVLQWNLTTGALINTVILPGGSSNSGAFGLVVHCSGLDVDVTGNVYAGSMDRVVKFDANLNFISQSMTTGGFTVYDVSVNNNGEVIAVGALLNNSTSTGRGGRIESFNMAAGAQYSVICCNANFCPAGPLCVTDPAITLSSSTSGGTWTSVPATAGLNATTGVFDPAIAGIGTYVITYTIACGSSSSTIIVWSCVPMTVCVETNGDLTVTGGYGPYNWNEWVTTTITPSNSTECTTCGGIWFPGLPPFIPPSCSVSSCTVSGWSNFATGVTVTPPAGADTIQIVDALGNTLVMNDISTLPPCTAICDATITQAGPFCVTDAAVILTAVDPGGTWTGTGITNGTTGAFDPATAGVGNWVITYTLGCGDIDTMIIAINPTDTATFTYPSGSYCLTDPDPLPTGIITTGGVFTIDNSGSINSSTGLINISASGIGSYIVTYTTLGSCPDTATFNINIVNSTDATITQVGPFCANDPSVNLSAVSTGGTWTGTGITNGTTGTFDPATAGVGNWTITYTISGSCGDIDTMIIAINPTDTATFTYPSGSYCLTDPDPLPTGIITTGGVFTIDNSGSINSSTGLINISASGIGSYIVTYTTLGSCPDTNTVNVIINTCTLPLPVANFSASQTNICEGDCINFTDLSTSSATGGITNWSWNFVGSTTTTSSSQNPTNICYNTAGTYSVTLTVTDVNGIDDSTIINYITVTSCAPPTGGYTVSNDTICEGGCVDFTDQSSGATSWLWTFNNGSPNSSTNQNPTNVCFSTAGTYTIEQIVTNSNGSDTVTSSVVVNATPVISAGFDVTIDLGNSTTLTATGTNGTYTWSPPTWLSCVICVDPISTPDETITYTVTVVDSNGCTTSDEVTVFVDFDYIIWVPNIFSPNGDGNNDVLFVRGLGVAQFNFFMYDRWGEKVFETQDLNKGWDGSFRGKKMNNAVFVYYLEATFTDGTEVSQKGDITLIR